MNVDDYLGEDDRPGPRRPPYLWAAWATAAALATALAATLTALYVLRILTAPPPPPPPPLKRAGADPAADARAP